MILRNIFGDTAKNHVKLYKNVQKLAEFFHQLAGFSRYPLTAELAVLAGPAEAVAVAGFEICNIIISDCSGR